MSNNDGSERKEWIKVTRTKSGTTVACTVLEDNLTAKWVALADPSKAGLKAGVQEARTRAHAMLDDIASIVLELDQEAAA